MGIRDEVIEVLAKKAAYITNRSADEFGPETRFIQDLDAKSVNIVQFSAALEDEFDVEVPYMELARKATFADVADYIAKMFGE